MSDVASAVEVLRGTSAPADGVPIPIGLLAPVVAGAMLGLPRSDWWVPGPREVVGAVLRGAPIDGIAGGARPYRIAPVLVSSAMRALAAVGLALAERGHGALVHLGAGSTAQGDFYEGLNLAALQGAPVVFLVALLPLDRADSPLARQTAGTPEAIARALGLPVVPLDGRDGVAVRDAVAEARAAGGPAVLVARL